MHAGSAVLHGITQALVQIFEAQVPAQATKGQPSGRHINSSDLDMLASAGWQGKAASAVVALAEVVFGASASWQGAQQQQGGHLDFSRQHSQYDSSFTANQEATTSADPITAHADSNGRESLHSAPTSRPADLDSGVLEPIVVQVLDDFSNAGVWSLATHMDPDATMPGNTLLTPQVYIMYRLSLHASGPCCCARLGPPCMQRLMACDGCRSWGRTPFSYERCWRPSASLPESLGGVLPAAASSCARCCWCCWRGWPTPAPLWPPVLLLPWGRCACTAAMPPGRRFWLPMPTT